MAKELRAAAARHEQLAARAPVAAAAAAQVGGPKAPRRRLVRALGRLPHRDQLEKMVAAAGVLGERLRQRMAPAGSAQRLRWLRGAVVQPAPAGLFATLCAGNPKW